MKRSLPFLTLLLVASANFGVAFAVDDWREDARRFTGESAAVREAAIARLRKREHLAAELEKAMATRDRFLAFDVVTALRVRELLPFLLRYSAQDRSGYSYHVINSLLEPGEVADTLRLYRDRLADSRTSLAAKVTLIDSLARTREPLEDSRVRRLLRDDAPEIRSAALEYVRGRILDHRQFDFLSPILISLGDTRIPLRIQALYLVDELPAEAHLRVPELRVSSAALCREDSRLAKEPICRKGGSHVPAK